MLNLCDLICFEDEKTKDTGRRMSTYQRPPVSGYHYPMFQGFFFAKQAKFWRQRAEILQFLSTSIYPLLITKFENLDLKDKKILYLTFL